MNRSAEQFRSQIPVQLHPSRDAVIERHLKKLNSSTSNEHSGSVPMSAVVALSIALAGCAQPSNEASNNVSDQSFLERIIAQIDQKASSAIEKTEAVISDGVTKTIESVAKSLQNDESSSTNDISPEAQAFLDAWPKTVEEAATKFGGDASQWMRNSEWPDSRKIDNVNLGVFGYPNIEWRPVNPENLPFNWPKTPEEAAEYFFPGQNIDPRFMQPAWIDPITGLVTGWHLSEDHWLEGSEADVILNIHKGEVGEGYTVNGTLEPKDDRFFVVFGGFQDDPSHDQLTLIQTTEGQGWTIWMPGTDPNSIGLRMEQFNGQNNDTPYYQGKDKEQLGPDTYGLTPIYPSPQNNG